MEIHLSIDNTFKSIVFIVLTHLTNKHKTNIYLYVIATLPVHSRKVQANLYTERFINRL